MKQLTSDSNSLLRSRKGSTYWRASMRAAVLFAELANGQLVGFVEVDLRPFANGCSSSPVGYLEGWFVKAQYRRRGIGTRLVRAAEDWARKQGCVEMASDAFVDNRTSHAAHRALGYSEVDRLVTFRRDLRRTER